MTQQLYAHKTENWKLMSTQLSHINIHSDIIQNSHNRKQCLLTGEKINKIWCTHKMEYCWQFKTERLTPATRLCPGWTRHRRAKLYVPQRQKGIWWLSGPTRGKGENGPWRISSQRERESTHVYRLNNKNHWTTVFTGLTLPGWLYPHYRHLS